MAAAWARDNAQSVDWWVPDTGSMLRDWGPFHVPPPAAKDATLAIEWLDALLRLLLTVLATVWRRIGPMLRQDVLVEYSQSPAEAWGLLTKLTSVVSRHLHDEIAPYWQPTATAHGRGRDSL